MNIPLLHIHNMTDKKCTGTFRTSEIEVCDSYSSPWQISDYGLDIVKS